MPHEYVEAEIKGQQQKYEYTERELYIPWSGKDMSVPIVNNPLAIASPDSSIDRPLNDTTRLEGPGVE